MALADKVAELCRIRELKENPRPNKPDCEQLTFNSKINSLEEFDEIYKPICQDMFDFLRKYYFVNDDPGWENTIQQYRAIEEKYKDSDVQFVTDMIVAAVLAIERKYISSQKN